jgi:alpha-tubulin suppressor-like RCC1 family protein
MAQRNAPTTVLTSLGGPALTGVVQISAGSDHSCARLMTGNIECWGWNQDGELGDGSNMTSPSPVMVVGVAGATDLAGGGEHECATLPSGAVHCWGNDTFGEAPATVVW